MEVVPAEYLQDEALPSPSLCSAPGSGFASGKFLGDSAESHTAWQNFSTFARSNTSLRGRALASFPLEPPTYERYSSESRRGNRSQHVFRGSTIRRDTVIFGWAVGIAVLFSLSQEVAKVALFPGGCDWNHAEGAANTRCARLGVYVIPMTALAKQVAAICVGLGDYFIFLVRLRRFWRAMQHGQKRGVGSMDMTAEQRVLIQGHWTPAASLDTFRETSRLLVDAQLLVFFLVGTTTVAVTVSQAGNAIDAHEEEGRLPWRAVACCPDSQAWGSLDCSQVCMLGNAGLSTMLTATIGLACVMIASLIFIPCELWSPITLAAAKKENDVQLQRLLYLPLPLFGFISVNFIIFAIYAARMFLEKLMAHRLIWEVVFIVCVLLFTVELLVVAWVLPWKRVLQIPAGLRSQVMALLTAKSSRVAPEGPPGQPARNLFWQCRECSRYRQLVLLFCSLFAFGIDVLRADGTSGTEIWVIRVICLVLVGLCFDEPVDFDVLHHTGAAFGLVVNARQLKRALQAHLHGRQYTGQISRYKGSLLRMCDTMAVSYRWQSAMVEVGPSVTLNMTDWQIQQLVLAIDRTACLYVWLDGFSVPQEDQDVSLKQRLLSRMMAVYGSAFLTLVLMSKERELDRYHQRMWTLQEFCASKQLLTATEEGPESTDGSSVAEGLEQVHSEAQRKKHMEDQGRIMPVWLGHSVENVVRSISSADAHRIWNAYTILSAKRHSLYQSDSVRALYPLLWNRPAESEAELKELIRAVQDVHGIPQTRVLRLLLDYSIVDDNRMTARLLNFVVK